MRDAPNVSDPQVVQIKDWKIMQIADGVHTLVGWLQDGPTTRMTTAIWNIDCVERKVITKSGRVYHLAGPPTDDAERTMIILVRFALAGFDPDLLVDISDRVWSQMLRRWH